MNRKPPANSQDRKVNTKAPVGPTGGQRLPHERDESPEGVQHQKPRSVIRQAAADVEQGLVDTDRRATPGLQKAPPGNAAQARPLPGTKRD